MNTPYYYPRDTLTFAREPQHIKPEPTVWTMTYHEMEGLSVIESDHESAWALFDAAQQAQDRL